MRWPQILIPILLAGASTTAAQTIKVAPSVLVASGSSEHPLTEPYLAVNPVHPDQMLAVAYLAANPRLTFPAGQEEQLCSVFLSMDAGANWTRHDFDVTWCADPWAAFTPDGQALVTMLGKYPALAAQGSAGLLAFHSADGGRSWDSLPVGLGRNHDHPTLAVDFSSGHRRGWIYVSSHRGRSAEDGRFRYGVYVARSRTGGRSFDDPVWIIPNNLHNLAEMPVVLSDGTLVESFVDATYSADSGGTAGREVLFDRRRAWIVRSTDGGYTFSPPLFVTDACGPPPGYRLSAFAADVSGGPFDGRLYFTCRAASGGPIIVTHSRDRGETWSPVTRMHSPARDTLGYPIPGLAVNDRGIVLVAWLGARARANACGSDLYASASTDGGSTFSPPVAVASCSGGGDYFGVASAPGGRFRVLWPETRDAVRELRMTTLEVVR